MYNVTRDWHLMHTFHAHGTDKQGQGKFPVPTLLTLFPTLPGKQEPARRSMPDWAKLGTDVISKQSQ